MSDVRGKIKFGIAAVGMLTIAVLAVIFFQFRQYQTSQSIPLPESATKALLSLAKIHQTATQGGKIQWEMDAKTASLEDGSQKLLLNAPTITFYMEDGSRLELTAQRGVLNTQNKDMVVEGSVHLTSNQYTVKTEKLTYIHEGQVLETDNKVNITSKSGELQANSMTYHMTTNQASFSGQVEVDFIEKANT